MTIAWIIGSNGLLGSALGRALNCTEAHIFTSAERFRWHNESELMVQLKTAVKTFAAFVGIEKNWQIYWAAGVGTMRSTKAELAMETRILSTLLRLIESEPGLIVANGSVIFASSAGAIYAGATDDIINENTPVAPTTDYAREKLEQEHLLNAFAMTHSRVTVLIARISTLYGPGHSSGKQQGLVAEIARRILRHQPIQIYVPFDTIRDYITADDAAATILVVMSAIDGRGGVVTKIIASEQPTTISEIIAIYKKIARRSPRIVTSASKLSILYNRRIQFYSIVHPINGAISKTSLFVGIAQVMAAERVVFTQSRV